MSGKLDLHKGAPCLSCGKKKEYEENGRKVCNNCGLEKEGTQTQQDDDNLGPQGRKTRIRRESQEKSYQLILWKQCYALINTIGLDKRLEKLVKALWALKLQLVKGKIDATTEEDTVFSSQPVSETEPEDEETIGKTWKARQKKPPALIETLALLYLGAVLLRLPVSIGDIHRWAVREDIPFIRAVRSVPAIMKQKLPAQYLKALDTTNPLEPDHVRKAVHNVSLFYAHHFDLELPPINATPLLFKHIHDLALPISLHPITLNVAAQQGISFDFPSPKTRQRIISLPEVSLISLLVIATKLYHPFDETQSPRHARSFADPAALVIDWAAWVSAQQAQDAHLYSMGSLPRGSEINVTEKDIMAMEGEELDQYMDYFERTFIDEERLETKSKRLPKELLDMFPTARLDGSSPVEYIYKDQEEKEQASKKETMKKVMGSLRLRTITPEESEQPVLRIGSLYKRYRTVEEMQGRARTFHEKVAEVVGMKLESLLLAVNQMERKLIVWKEAEDKKERDESGS